MFVLGNFLIAVASILGIILHLMKWIILIRALISWVNPDPYNPVVQFLYRTTEPILQPIRRFMPPMGMDFSPIIAFFGIIFLQMFLVASIHDLGARMKYQSGPAMNTRTEVLSIDRSETIPETSSSGMSR